MVDIRQPIHFLYYFHNFFFIMAGININNFQTLALALPFNNCSDAQIQSEFLGMRETILEKYKCSNFFKEMSRYTNTFTTNNYKCNYYDVNSFNSSYTRAKSFYPKICHLNIRSLNLHKKFQSFKVFIE